MIQSKQEAEQCAGGASTSVAGSCCITRTVTLAPITAFINAGPSTHQRGEVEGHLHSANLLLACRRKRCALHSRMRWTCFTTVESTF